MIRALQERGDTGTDGQLRPQFIVAHRDLRAIWQDHGRDRLPSYAPDCWDDILAVMAAMKMSFIRRGGEQSMIVVGDLLPEYQPVDTLPWRYDEGSPFRKRRFELAEEADGFFAFLVSYLGPYLDETDTQMPLAWQSGMFLHSENRRTDALVEYDTRQGPEIAVETRGPGARALMDEIVGAIETLRKDRFPKLDITDFIPCPTVTQRGPCRGEFLFSDLIDQAKQDCTKLVRCQFCKEERSVAELLDEDTGSDVNLRKMAADLSATRALLEEDSFRRDYPCPRIFTLKPKQGGWFSVDGWKKPVKRTMVLTFYCEQSGRAAKPLEFTATHGWLVKLKPFVALGGMAVGALGLSNLIGEEAMGDLGDAHKALSQGEKLIRDDALADAEDEEARFAKGSDYQKLINLLDERKLYVQDTGLAIVKRTDNRFVWADADAREELREEVPIIPPQH